MKLKNPGIFVTILLSFSFTTISYSAGIQTAEEVVQNFYDNIFSKVSEAYTNEFVLPVFGRDPQKDKQSPAFDLVVDDTGGIRSIGPRYANASEWKEPIRQALLRWKLNPAKYMCTPVWSHKKLYFKDYLYLVSKHDGDLVLPVANWSLDSKVIGRIRTLNTVDSGGPSLFTFHVDAEGNTTKIRSRSDSGRVVVKNYFAEQLDVFKFTPLKVNGEPTACKMRLRIDATLASNHGYDDFATREWFGFDSDAQSELISSLAPGEFRYAIMWSPSGRVNSVVPLTENTPFQLTFSVIANIRKWQSKALSDESQDSANTELITIVLNEDGRTRLQDERGELFRYRQAVRKSPVRLEYPLELKSRRIQGAVRALIDVHTDGSASLVKVIESSDPKFSEAAERAIERVVFSPASVNDVPIRMRYTQILSFRLD